MALQHLGHDRLSKERTDDVSTKENVSFKDLLLSPVLLSGLQKARFDRPSPIQLKAIPYGRCGLDLIVQAKSGTGKTCVFTVIALEAISVEASTLQVIILAPTREIAIQIEDVVKAVGQDIKGLKVAAFIGGRPVSEDKFNAKGCHIAVGSPGRIFQLIELEILKCQNVRMFVLDEADKLLEDNFQSQINSIYSMLPVNKQMIAASATYPEELAEFVTRYMRDPTFVRLNPKDMALLGIKQYYYIIKDPPDKSYSVFECKIKAVIELLELHTFQQTLIFSNYHSHAKDLSDACNSAGLPATYISGNMEQQRRLEAMKMLKDFKCRVLISTDLTSRGIDASNVDLVVNLDVPHDWETYMHRTGRAGRFGSLGAIVSVVNSGKEMDELFRIVDSCAISLYQITVENGKLHFGTEAAEIISEIKNVEQELNTPNIQVDKQDSTMQPLRGSESLKTGADLDTVRESSPEKLCELNQSKTLSTQHKPPRASRVKIPTLPELMSRKPRPKYSFSYKDLMENLLFYKEHGVFQKLKIIKQSTGVEKIEQNSDNCNENSSVTMRSASEVRPNKPQGDQNNANDLKLLLKTHKGAESQEVGQKPICGDPSKKQAGYNAIEVRKAMRNEEKTKLCRATTIENLCNNQKEGRREHTELENCEKLSHNLNKDEVGDRKLKRKGKRKKTKSKTGDGPTRSTPRLLLPRYTGVGDDFSADDISYFVNMTRQYQSAWHDYYYYHQYWTWWRCMYSSHG